jgi:hypothetical protein
MKYLSVVLFTVLLAWTWSIVHNSSPVAFETHAAIQTKVADIIVQKLMSAKPNVSEVTVDQIWTELVNDNNVIAHFNYRYKEPVGESGVTENKMSGTGRLTRLPDDGSGTDRWRLSDVKTSNDSVAFEEALIITSGPNETQSN